MVYFSRLAMHETQKMLANRLCFSLIAPALSSRAVKLRSSARG